MSIGESQVIEILKTIGARRADVVVGIGDDAAVLDAPRDQRLVLCADTIVEDVHFPAGTSAFDIGWRALAVNLSDLAAMAAQPRWAALSLSLPAADADWVRHFARGFSQLAEEYDVALVGGDTVRGPLAASVTLIGTVSGEAMLLRSGARAGHGLWVTGTLGDAAAGLRLFSGEGEADAAALAHLYARFFRPQPRLRFGIGLGGLASAAIDLSDGLYTDAQRLSEASGVGMEINVGRVPVSDALCSTLEHGEMRTCAIIGGDDYELLFTLAPDKEPELEGLAARHDISCARIGTVVDGETVTYALEGKPWMPSHTTFEHFAAGEPE